MRTGDVDRAIQDVQSAAKDRQLQELQANLLLSQAYSLKGELDLADQTLSQAVNHNKEKQNAGVLLSTLGWIRLQRGRVDDAERMATMALNSDPHSEQALYLLGASFLSRKESAKAIQIASDYVQKFPNWVAGYDILGKLALQGGRPDRAEEAFKKALELRSDSFASLLGLADTYTAENKIDLAYSAFQQLAQRSPSTGFVRMRLGQLEEQMGQWQVAEKSYQQAIALDPNNAAAKNNLAWLYVQHGGDLDMALKLAQEAKEVFPQDAHIADTLGWILAQKGAYETAEENFKLSVEKNPSSPTYMYHLGMVHYKMGQIKQAREELGRALSGPAFPAAEDARKMLADIPKLKN
jgi:tetratricopeptide (TPR) repeat protein